jgi:ankyrin repeat protein
MYPDPTAALLLPARPSLEHYRKRAKDLLKAADSEDAIREWAAQFPPYADDLARFAAERLRAGKQRRGRSTLADAQFVIARAYGFLSWPRFVAHVEALADDSPTFAFESAVDGVVRGDAARLRELLHEHPGLARQRSTREHEATLLHYTSANGVEGERQISPHNAPAIAELLLAAGAEVDAEANVYGGGCTTLGLVATSMPPFQAGVQRAVIDVLLAHGARLDHPGAAGNRHALVHGCLANGQPDAARYLASRGAPLDLRAAAGIGRLDVVQSYFDGRASSATIAERDAAFAFACAYGEATIVEFLLQQGVAVDTRLNMHGSGHTGLHVAAYHAHVSVVRVLLRHDASVTITDDTWHTPPLVWALHAWSSDRTSAPEHYAEVVRLLVNAGAQVQDEWLRWDKVHAAPEMRAALESGRGTS